MKIIVEISSKDLIEMKLKHSKKIGVDKSIFFPLSHITSALKDIFKDILKNYEFKERQQARDSSGIYDAHWYVFEEKVKP